MRNNIVKSLNKLKEKDVYSLVLFCLYKLKDIPEYSVLSELVYAMDKDSLLKFISLFGGMTITIPTADELKVVINALQVYDAVNFKDLPYKEAIKECVSPDTNIKDLDIVYQNICDTLSDYTFESRE